MAAIRGVAGLAIALFVVLGTADAQDRPLRTADPVPIAHGWLAIEGGVDFLEGVAFPLSGLSGDLLRVPSLSFRLGLGGIAEFQVASGLNLLFIDDRRPAPFADMVHVDGDVSHDIDDPVVATKIRLHEETRWGPATGLRVATRLPSAGNKSGLGTDTTDFLLWVLAAKSLARMRLLANVGLGVLSVPEDGDRQNDVLLYGLAAQQPLNDRLAIAAEIQGRKDTQRGTPAGTEDTGQARIGARWSRGSVVLDGALIYGLHAADTDFGATFGLTWLGHALW